MRKSLSLIPLAAASLAIATTAQAQGQSDRLAKLTERFEKADANGDGKLTQQEAKEGGMKRIAENFGRIDSDGDGFVTLDQIKALISSRNR